VAELGGDDIIVQQARRQLARLQEKQPPSGAGNDAATQGL